MPDAQIKADLTIGPDPTPWRHVSGERATDPHALGAPTGGYTYDPREGFSDYPDRYLSTARAKIEREEG